MADDFSLPFPVPGDPIRASDIANISRVLGPLANMDRGAGISYLSLGGMQFRRANQPTIYDIPVYNGGEDEIPSYGIIRIDTDSTIDGPVITGKKPNTYGSQYSHLLNGPQPIPVDDIGLATNTFPALVAYDTGDSPPVVGEAWGPRAAGYLARRETGGFRIAARPNTTDGLVLVVRQPMLTVRGKNNSDVPPDSSVGVFTIYTGTFGSEVTTGQNMASPFNASSCIVNGDPDIATAIWIPDLGGWQYIVGVSP